MDNLIALNDVINLNDSHYSGGSHYTVIQNSHYSFIKGFLSTLPARFMHPLFHVKKEQCACYLIRETQDGKIYVGSSSKIYKRITRHKEWILRLRRHPNKVLSQIAENRNPSDFELIIFFTSNREEAYRLEQFFVNRYKETDQLINIAYDVRHAMRGHIFSEEHKRKISEANTGRAIGEQTRLNISSSRRNSIKAQEQLAVLHAKKRRRIQVDGVEYESVAEASSRLGISECVLYKTAAKPGSKVKFLDNVKSPLSGRTLTPEQKLKLSLLRKNNESLKNQLSTIRHLTQKKIVLNDVLYESITQAARETKIGESTIRRRLRETNFPKNQEGNYVVFYQYSRKKPNS